MQKDTYIQIGVMSTAPPNGTASPLIPIYIKKSSDAIKANILTATGAARLRDAAKVLATASVEFVEVR